MKISITAFIFILLNFAQAGENRQIRMSLEKTSGFLWIFKYVNYRTEDKTSTTDFVVNVNQKAYDWYFWSGYYEKFASGTYTLQIQTTTNTEAPSVLIATFDAATKPKALIVNNFELPNICKTSDNYSYTIENKGWEKTKKLLDVKFTCTNKQVVSDGVKEDIKKVEEKVDLSDKPLIAEEVVGGETKKSALVEKEDSKSAKKEENLLAGIKNDDIKVENQGSVQKQEELQDDNEDQEETPEVENDQEDKNKESSLEDKHQKDDENKSHHIEEKLILL